MGLRAKKAAALIAAAVIVLSMAAPPARAAGFPDVGSSDWFRSDVETLTASGAVNGYPDGTFRPQNDMSRAEFVKVLVSALKLSGSAGGFTDTETNWAASYIGAASASGALVPAEYGGVLRPDEPVTRLEIARMISRALKLSGSGAAFVDSADKYVLAASAAYIVNGVYMNGKYYFLPSSNVTRAEAAAMLVRAVRYRTDPVSFTALRKAELALTPTQTADLPSTAGDPTAAQLRSLLAMYDPDGSVIVEEMTAAGDDISSWFGSGLSDDANTVVHEEYHASTNYGIRWWTDSYYLGNGVTADVPFSDVFDAEEMDSAIPEDLRTFRYSTYVGPDAEVTANYYGAYGMLNEFVAYYYGTRTSYRLFDYYATLPQTEALWQDYNSGIWGTYSAYAEFRYYILTYLIYAKANHPETYDSIMANSAFRQVYKSVEPRFAALCRDYLTVRSAGVRKMLEAAGYATGDADFGFWCYDSSGYGRGFIVKNDDYTALMKAMEAPEYTAMQAELTA